ncbi:MAG: hypothetical protein HC830_00810 [Bacteroidetes bacterium]|nr:hypothetical protein [Bacteroidota bacterium]
MKNALLLLLLLCSVPTVAQYNKLYEFSSENDLAYPLSVVSDGTYLYGATEYGGLYGKGTVYRTNLDGSDLMILVNFNDISSPEGSFPYGGITLDNDTLYGTTGYVSYEFGPTSSIFKVNKNGSGFKSLQYGSSRETDVRNPVGSLSVVNSKYYGSNLKNTNSQLGSIIGIGNPALRYTQNAKSPNGSLVIIGSKAYGTASKGGANDKGVLFSIGLDGNNYTSIHEFDEASGSNPLGTICISGDTIFGTTSGGGDYGKGTVYRIQINGTNFSTLHHFDGVNGSNPNNSVFLSDSKLYGMTKNGGENDKGVVFQLNTNGTGFPKCLFLMA